MTAVAADPSVSAREAVPPPRRTDLATRLFYGSGAVAFGVKDNGFSYMLLFFYGQVVGVPTALVGLALFITLLFDACIDPLIGQISDHLRTPWGRRHPFMYAAALPFALCYLALWNPPHASKGLLFAYLVVMAIIIRTFSSCFEVPSSALSAEFSSGYEERSILLSYRYFFGWVGGLTVNLLAYAVLLTPDKAHHIFFGQLNPVGYSHYGMVAAAIIFVFILISAAGTHRHIKNLMQPPPRARKTFRQTLAEMRETLSNRSFLFLLVAGVFSAMAAGLGPALNSYFNTYYWAFKPPQISILTAGVYLSAFIALFATPQLSRRFGKRAITRTMMVLSVATGITPLVLRLVGLMPPNGSLALLAVIFVTSVIQVSFGIIWNTTNSSMIADVVEEAELKTRRRSEGLFFAGSAFIAKSVSGFGILAASVIVSLIHLQPGADPASVPAEVPRHLAEIYIPVLVGLYTAAFLLLGGYTITRASHAETLQRLAAEAEELREPAAAAE
jgi:Na+/melibiose symporter-like transporter